MKLEDICDLLHIGRNTYGRWERGEVEITPSMNLLVHNLIEKGPAASVNLALSQAKAPQKVTSPKAATAASKVLRDGWTSRIQRQRQVVR